MKIFLIEVKGSSVGTNLVFIDYWILGRLENDKEIEIFDSKPFNLSNYQNKQLNCLIHAWIQEIGLNENNFEFKGIFIKDYEIPPFWFKKDPK